MTRKTTCSDQPQIDDVVLQSVCHELGCFGCYTQRKTRVSRGGGRYSYGSSRTRTATTTCGGVTASPDYIDLEHLCRIDPNVAVFLKINGIDLGNKWKGSGGNGKSSLMTRNKMTRTRNALSFYNSKNTSPGSGILKDDSGGGGPNARKLRTRHTTVFSADNFVDMSGDDDSNHHHITPIRELRSSSRLALALVKSVERNNERDTWESGRPKRNCLKQQQPKKLSFLSDKRLTGENKTFYNRNSDLLSSPPSVNKMRSNDINGMVKRKNGYGNSKATPVVRPVEDSGDEKVFKIKKTRDTQLNRLNSEAENFLFPRKEESSSNEEDDDNNDDDNEDVAAETIPAAMTTMTTTSVSKISPIPRKRRGRRRQNNYNFKSVPASKKRQQQRARNNGIKSEHHEESSMDSTETTTTSSSARKRRRMTQAEAFILDNQKYYKFETPGSRLRYQGSYLAPMAAATTASSKSNGEHGSGSLSLRSVKKEIIRFEEEERSSAAAALNLDELQFSFEIVPNNESWYKTFQRQDKGDECYSCYSYSTGFYKPFLMPYEMGPLPPLDPRYCISNCRRLKKHCIENYQQHQAPKTSSQISKSSEALSNCDNTNKFDEKVYSLVTASSSLSSSVNSNKTNQSISLTDPPCVKAKTKTGKPRGRPPAKRSHKRLMFNVTRNPRKSPRQHASTLAILSSLIHQRKRKEIRDKSSSPNKGGAADLSIISEGGSNEKPNEEEDLDAACVNYAVLSKHIDDMLSAPTSQLDETDDGLLLQFGDESEAVDFDVHGKLDPVELLDDWENDSEDDEKTTTRCRLLDGGKKRGRAPAAATTTTMAMIKSELARTVTNRRIVRKRKKNRTGWPNKNTRRTLFRKDDQTGEGIKKKIKLEQKDCASPYCDRTVESPAAPQLPEGEEEEMFNANERTVSEEENVSSSKSNKVQDTTAITMNGNVSFESSPSSPPPSSPIKFNGCSLNGLIDLKIGTIPFIGQPKRKENRESSSENFAEIVVTSDDRVIAESVEVDLDQWENAERLLSAKLRCESAASNYDLQFQPVVRVTKLNTEALISMSIGQQQRHASPPRQLQQHASSPRQQQENNISSDGGGGVIKGRRSRRMPASPKSPRYFRRPRGACYRERFSERIHY